MGRVQKGRFTADVSSLEDEAVVFLTGMRINKPWKVSVWWPVFAAMPKMLNYLAKQPDKGSWGTSRHSSCHRSSCSTGGPSRTWPALLATR
jgi:hypothetical protein